MKKSAVLPFYSLSTFNKEIKTSEFYCNKLSIHLRDHAFVNEGHAHGFYLNVYFKSGRGVHMIDFNEYQVKEGSVFFMKPGQFHSWKLSEDAEGFVVFHSGEFFDLEYSRRNLRDFPFYFSALSSPFHQVEASERKAIEELYIQILQEYNNDLPYRKDFLVNYLDLLYLTYSRSYVARAEAKVTISAYQESIGQFLRLLDQHFLEEKRSAFYASKLSITPRHLNRICQEVLRKTTSSVIEDRVILEAKRMLFDRRYSVEQTSETLGFKDVSYFVRYFKSHTGVTPGKFRN